LKFERKNASPVEIIMKCRIKKLYPRCEHISPGSVMVLKVGNGCVNIMCVYIG